MLWLYAAFVGFILLMLALDLGLVNRHAHVVRVREAIIWTVLTVALSLAFAAALYFMYERNWPAGIADHLLKDKSRTTGLGAAAVVQYLSGWITEYSLSVDNIFVIAVIFGYFRVPLQYQHRVLFWGVFGALVMRGAMIWLGAELLARFSWINYLFAAILLFTAVRLLMAGDEHADPEKNLGVRLARRLFQVSPEYHGQKFFTRVDSRLVATPLLLVLIVVESTDAVFAVDSIPAVFSLTTDPFLVFTSNVFAILGLRSLYFALAAAMNRFRFLKASLVFVLSFVAVKMLIAHWYTISTEISLPIIVGILLVGVVASLLASARDERRANPPAPAPPDIPPGSA